MPKLDRTEKVILTTAILLTLLAGFAPNLIPSHNSFFTQGDNHLPYKLEQFNILAPTPPANGGRAGSSFNVVDYYGDGIPQYVQSGNPGITGYEFIDSRHRSARWQFNVDGRFAWAKNCAGIFSGMDPDGDGRDEIIAYCHTENGSEHEIIAYDPLTERVEGRVSLPGGRDKNGDGKWDGYYIPCGSFSYRKNATTTINAVLVVCNVRYDGYGRGVYAVDLAGGEVLWHYAMGPMPESRNTLVKDLDGDGWQEIVVGAKAPSNLGKELINGTSDTQTMVFVLNSQGKLQWSRVLAPRSCGIDVNVVDSDRDGRWSVITTASSVTRKYSEIIVWHGLDGTQESRTVFPYHIMNHATVQASVKGSSDRVVSSQGRSLFHLNISPRGAEIYRQLQAPQPIRILFRGDLLPNPGLEIVAMIRGLGLWVLDQDFEPLAVYDGNSLASAGFVMSWNIDKGHNYLLCANENYGCLKLSEKPYWQQVDPKPGMRTSSVLLLASGAMFFRRRYRNFYKQKLDLNDPNILRELRLRLLGDLELSGHGAVGVLKSLRRLIWNLESRCAGLGRSREMNEQLNTRMDDFINAVLPHVRDILGLADRADISRISVPVAGLALDEVERIFTHLADVGFSPENIQNELIALQDAADEAEAGLQKIRRTVEDLFRSDLKSVLDLVLRARQDDLDTANINLLSNVEGAAFVCRLDETQLEFMLDNLVGNAIRAMGDSADPQLRITASLADGFVVCEVADTGWGIDPKDWSRVMETPYSSRKGGGLGLFETNRILRLYGGMIAIKDSKPGEGTTVRLAIPEARSNA